MILLRLAPLGLATAKCLAESATEERVTALGDAIDDRDPEWASEVLKTWLADFQIAPGEADLVAQRIADRLVAIFSAR